MRRTIVAALLLAAVALPAGAQTVSLGDLACVPASGNAVVAARVDPPPTAENPVRLYFRRLNVEVEDFYYVDMKGAAAGNFWGVLPKAESTRNPRKDLRGAARDAWAAWWKQKEASADRDPNGDLDGDLIRERASLGKVEKRDWMAQLGEPSFESWLERQKLEPAEYFVAVVDPSGRRLARSEIRVAEVTGDCRAALTPQQQGAAQNLVVGHTSNWQDGQPVFHWLCDGVVTRVDPQGVLRADEACRACVVGWWPRTVAGGLGAIGAIVIYDDNPREVSPSRP